MFIASWNVNQPKFLIDSQYGARIDHSPTGIQIGDHPNNLALLSSMCSPEAADCVDEDLNRTRLSRATGFIGKSSEISWMRQLWCETNSRTQRSARSEYYPIYHCFALCSLPRS